METLVYITELERALALANEKLAYANKQLENANSMLAIAKLVLRNQLINGKN
jgi:hypothetical protein